MTKANGMPFVVVPIFEWNWKSDKPIVVNQGGTSCFACDTLITTIDGVKPIHLMQVGDIVPTMNEATKEIELKPVVNVLRFENHKPTVKIRLKNGKEIICTDDHEFYVGGTWISIKHLLSSCIDKHKK
jgi:hypothetical protein